MPPLTTIRAFNASWRPTYTPVAVFVGGTSGIGQGIVQAFAKRTNGNAHIILVGRNAAAAERILGSLEKPSAAPMPTREFMHCDLTLVANAKRTTAAIRARFPGGAVNFVFLTAGAVSLKASEITPEGVEYQVAQLYYSKWAFIDGLLPALRAAREAGQDARVAAVHTAGRGTPVDVADLGLKKTLAGGMRGMGKVFGQVASYQDLMAEGFAAHDTTGITFTHAFPGSVSTPLMANSPSAALRVMRHLRWVIMPLSMLRAKSIDDVGDCQLYGLLHAPAGASRYGGDGDDMGLGGQGDGGWDKAREALWTHTEEIVKSVQV
ncbi:hypothetical protein MKEN_00198900 [Mycena kentingensis (nom. inval.)]|nr:hypothetical protein MKEN_00198900 [Mycena kentingensis (nom. inval.)]